MIVLNKFYLLSLISKYRLQLIDYTPGEVTVKIASWATYEEKLREVIAHLQKDKAVYAIDVAGDVVHIRFDPEVMNEETKVNDLLGLVSKYNL